MADFNDMLNVYTTISRCLGRLDGNMKAVGRYLDLPIFADMDPSCLAIVEIVEAVIKRATQAK